MCHNGQLICARSRQTDWSVCISVGYVFFDAHLLHTYRHAKLCYQNKYTPRWICINGFTLRIQVNTFWIYAFPAWVRQSVRSILTPNSRYKESRWQSIDDALYNMISSSAPLLSAVQWRTQGFHILPFFLRQRFSNCFSVLHQTFSCIYSCKQSV